MRGGLRDVVDATDGLDKVWRDVDEDVGGSCCAVVTRHGIELSMQ